MIEHYGLSQAQKDYLYGSKKVSNESKERKAIKRKAFQAWSVFKPILESKVVSDKWKYSLFGEMKDSDFDTIGIPKDRFTFRHFINALLKTNATNPASKEIDRMAIAKTLIDEGVSYYQMRFTNNQLVYDKMTEYGKFLEMLQEIYEQDLTNLVKADFIRLRKGMPVPPHIEPNEYYHAVCIQCYSYSLNQAKNEQDAVHGIEHSKDCPFVKEFARSDKSRKTCLIRDFIKFTSPILNK